MSSMTGDAPDKIQTTSTMPPWIPRAIALFWLGLISIWVLQHLFEDLSGFLLVLLISLFFSFALEPAVNWLEHKGFRRGLGTLIMFSLFVAAVALLSFIVGSALAEQTTSFVDDAPALFDDVEVWLQDNVDSSIELDEARNQFLSDDGLGQRISGWANNAVGLGATVVSLIFDLFTVALFTFYLAADGPRLRRSICSRLRPERQRRILGIWDLAIQKTGGYILSRTVLATISALVTWIVFSVIGVPFPLALAVWVGIVSQFVPVVGVYIAGALPVLLTLLESPISALWALLFLLAYQQFENYLLAPRVDARTLKIHPAVSFGSVVAGAAVLGPVGALLALPAAATAQGIISASGERYDIMEGPLTRLGPEKPRPASVVAATLPVREFSDDGNDAATEETLDESDTPTNDELREEE